MEETNQEKWYHNVVVDDLGGLKRKINITYNIDGVKVAMEKATNMVGKDIQLKGFRKGKAPAKMIEKVYYEDIRKTAISLLAQEGFFHACYEQKLSPLNEPKVENADIKLDGTFGCDIFLEVRPTIVPMGYVGMELKKPEIDEEKLFIQRMIDLKQHHSKKEIRKEVQEKFEVLVDYWILVDKEQISNGVDKTFQIRKGQELPFGENLLGAKMGDMVTAIITLPDNYPKYENKQAEVKIEIKTVTETMEPTDEQLVERMNAPSYEKLVKIVREDIKRTKEQQERAHFEEQIVDNLLAMHEFDVPESWVTDEEKYLIQQFNLSNPDDETKNIIKTMAARNVKRTFMTESIYDLEKSLAITQEEFEEFIKHEADRNNISSLALKEQLKKNNLMDGVLGIIKNGKVMNMILSSAQIIEEAMPLVGIAE